LKQQKIQYPAHIFVVVYFSAGLNWHSSYLIVEICVLFMAERLAPVYFSMSGSWGTKLKVCGGGITAYTQMFVETAADYIL
jgi:hypothetical protein